MGGCRVGGVKGQLSLRPVATSVVRERMRKAPALQSGRALPMCRCASPRWVGVIGGGGLFASPLGQYDR